MSVYTFDKFWKQKVNVCLYIWQALEIIKANVGFSQQSFHYINVVNLSNCNWQLNEFLKYTLMHLRYDTLIYMIFNSLAQHRDFQLFMNNCKWLWCTNNDARWWWWNFSLFRNGYCVLQLDRISGGVYNVLPSTFLPGQEGPFFLDISSAGPVTLAQIQ